MRFEDTELPDTPLMRDSFYISWAFTQTTFEDDEAHMRFLGFESAEALYKQQILNPIEIMMMEESPNALVVSAHMVELAFTADEFCLEGFMPEVVDLIRSTLQKMTLFEALCGRMADGRTNGDTLARYKAVLALGPEHETLLKVGLIPVADMISGLYEDAMRDEKIQEFLAGMAAFFIEAARAYDTIFTKEGNPYVHMHVRGVVQDTLPLCTSVIGLCDDDILGAPEPTDDWHDEPEDFPGLGYN